MCSEDPIQRQLHQLSADLSILKSIFQNPKLYLSEGFLNLTNQIDVEAQQMLNTKTDAKSKNQEKEMNKILENWDILIEHVQAFQANCLAHFTKFDKDTSEFIGESIKSVEDKLAGLKDFEKQMKSNKGHVDDDLEEAEMNYFELEANVIDDLIYEATFKLQSILNQDRCIFFLEKEIFEGYCDEKVFFGKLIKVTNAFFGTRGIKNLKEAKLGTDEIDFKKSTNEFLKTFFFAQKKSQYLTSHIYNEIELNCANEICLPLYNNNFVTLKADLFNGFQNLTYIDLSRNNLTSLPNSVFCHLTSLNVLNLGGNSLVTLDPEMFFGLTNLTALNLASNELQNIDSQVFKYLPKVSYLSLSFNHMNSLCHDTFHGLKHLTNIEMTSNYLKQIDSRTFHGLFDLTNVNFSYNQIEAFNCNMFSGLLNLKCVDLSFNRCFIPDSDFFVGMSKNCKFYLNEEQRVVKCLNYDELDVINLDLAYLEEEIY